MILKPVGAINTGFVEIHHGSDVGYICASSLTTYEAKVLCRQMGFVDGKPGYVVICASFSFV